MEENSPGAPASKACKGLFRQLIFCIPLLFLIVLYWGQTVVLEWEGLFGYGKVEDYGLPDSVIDKFRLFDSNADGYIDPYEFSILHQHFYVDGIQNLDFNYTDYEFNDEEIGTGKEVVFIHAAMKPLIRSSMAKFSKGEEYIFGSMEKLLPGLLAWKDVHVHTQMYGARNFRNLLPPNGWPIGKPYYIIEDKGEFTSMNRYHPPRPSSKIAFLHSILAQFHPNIFMITRFGPKGTIGIIRGKNNETMDIVFRVHAEFQLNTEPDHPFWFTPAQFLGRLITDLHCNHIYYFELKLPTNKQLNIDMEWIIGQGSNEVDIGYVPLMKLSSSSSVIWEPKLKSPFVNVYDEHVYDVPILTWDEEITFSTAIQEIEQTFYPFKKLKYFPFLDAISLAVNEKKLIHLIMLWGALDDQSC